MIVVFREKLIELRAHILDRNFIFHPLSVFWINMSQPFILKVRYIFSVIFFSYSVLQQSVGKKTVSVSPQFLLQCGLLVCGQILPYILYPSYGKIRHQTCRIKCPCKSRPHLQLHLFKSPAKPCPTFGKGFFFLLHLSEKVCGCFLAEWFKGRIVRVIYHPGYTESLRPDDNLCSEKLKLRHKPAHSVYYLGYFIPIRYFPAAP